MPNKVDRHLLARISTTAYYALVDVQKVKISEASWTNQVKWVKASELAFDYKRRIETCKEYRCYKSSISLAA